MNEFGLIARCFAPLTAGHPGALHLTDDAGLLDLPAGYSLVASTDLLSEGVHFIGSETAGDLARKLLRVNLSDLAAMGATPLAYLLGLSLPKTTPDAWVADFAAGLADDQTRFGIRLLGGDTTATAGPLTLSLTALGMVERGTALQRRGAQPGDTVYVSGTIGDGALGLLAAQGKLLRELPRPLHAYLLSRYRLPEPRLALGQALRGVASAGMDVSDGLVQDLGHIAALAGCAAVIESPLLPLSDAAARSLALQPHLLPLLLGGGDDYELLFTAPAEKAEIIAALPETCGIAVTSIGRLEAGVGVRVHDAAGKPIAVPSPGFRHFE